MIVIIILCKLNNNYSPFERGSIRFFKYCMLICILFLIACNIEEDNIEKLSINYWDKEIPFMVLYPEEDSKDIQLFLNAIKNTELLNDQVITTNPLLSFNMDLSD